MITKLQELLNILEENPEGVTQEEVGSLTDAINDRDIQQVNLQINTIKNGLNSDENQIQQGLDLDTFKEAIERFNNNNLIKFKKPGNCSRAFSFTY